MVVGVHDGTSNCRSDAHVTFPAGFSDLDVGMVVVAYFTDGGAALDATLRTSPEGRRTCAYFSSLAMSCAAFPAARTIGRLCRVSSQYCE
jgi:hypothetical protein